MMEFETTEALGAWLEQGRSLRGTVIQGLDLRELSAGLLGAQGQGAVFLGCTLDPEVGAHLIATGGLLFPALPGLPFQPYRPRLYDVSELMQGFVRGVHGSYQSTVDARIYSWYQQFRAQAGPGEVIGALAMRLHDHAIDDALFDLVGASNPPRIVGIMGGHGLRRDEPAFAQVASLGGALTRAGFTVASGGGPGAMEAAHLGAWMADHPLDQALAELSVAPFWRDPGWFDSALSVRERFPSARQGIGVPTWTYGHEPTNLFATHIAKYFSNAIREDVLVTIARHGIVFCAGSAGTVQEIFADATQNHYGTEKVLSPMVFLGREYWEEQLPVFPLLSRLASYRRYRDLMTVVDTEDEATEFIVAHPPLPVE